MWTVKEVIDNSGMTIEEFANHYEIPVETLKEWYNDKENKRNLLDREITKKRKKESGNGGYRQKITLKSKISRYILSDETHKNNIKNIRTYRK